MTTSYTFETSSTFTVAHARKLAAKVVADMYQCRQFYGQPSQADITDFNDELVVMLACHYVKDYEFGFKINNNRVWSSGSNTRPDSAI